jgi:hypothetical protein
MQRAGRFLWLDWAQGRFLAPLSNAAGQPRQVSGEHSGYSRLGVNHMRMLASRGEGHWLVQDSLVAVSGSKRSHSLQLHWLLPDWEWQMMGSDLVLHGSPGTVAIHIDVDTPGDKNKPRVVLGLVRAGERIAGTGPLSIQHGWFAPNYGEIEPVLSLLVHLETVMPVEITTTMDLISES